MGDGGWIAGNSTNTARDIWPASVTSTGIPLTKLYNPNGVSVYNSFMYANAIAWAIKYVQQNSIPSYILIL